ncbi:MAG: trypsin-like serine protease [Acidimicrobiia bacterium]|nr:trypsin-like serine protease [Acidimicrobiia bacterium]
MEHELELSPDDRAGDSSHTACNGDSGGPLTVDRPQGTVEVGVASFDRTGCDEAAGFAKLAGPQQAWIAANVSDANIGGCSLNYGSIPGRWTATYSQSGSRTLIDGPFHYGFTCQRTYPTMSSASMSSAAAPMAPA